LNWLRTDYPLQFDANLPFVLLVANSMSYSHSPPPEVSETNINGTAKKFSLENVLGDHHDDIEHPTIPASDSAATGWDEEQTEKPPLDGYCVECEGLYSLILQRSILTPSYYRSTSCSEMSNLRGHLLRSLLRCSASQRLA